MSFLDHSKRYKIWRVNRVALDQAALPRQSTEPTHAQGEERRNKFCCTLLRVLGCGMSMWHLHSPVSLDVRRHAVFVTDGGDEFSPLGRAVAVREVGQRRPNLKELHSWIPVIHLPTIDIQLRLVALAQSQHDACDAINPQLGLGNCQSREGKGSS